MLLSQSGSVENWFDLRLILGHEKSICSSIEDVSGLRVLCESVGVVNVVGGVVVGLDLGHLYWFLLTCKLKLNCVLTVLNCLS